MNEFYIEREIDGHPICINGVSLSKKETLQELNELARFQISAWKDMTKMVNTIKSLEQKLEVAEGKVEELNVDLGLMTISRDDLQNKLNSCEAALSERDKKVESLEKIKDAVILSIIEAEGEKVLLDKGYRPAFEDLVLQLGIAKDYFQNRLLIEPLAQHNIDVSDE